MKKRGDIVNLYDFVQNKTKTESNKKDKTLINASIEQKSKSNGLETLLHFNNSQILSSICSHRQEVQNIKNKESHYNKMVSNAKDQITEMKKRRIEMQKKWKGKKQQLQNEKKYTSRSYSQVLEDLNESQVQTYPLNTIFPTRTIYKQKFEVTDDFVLKLKKDILSNKVQKFTKTVIKIYTIRFVKQLKKYHEFVNYYQTIKSRITKQIFESWREAISQLQQRQKLKQVIIKRIKARKLPPVESYLPSSIS